MRSQPTRDAPAENDAKYYVELNGDRWCVTLGDAQIGAFNELHEASRFACDVARMQAQIGKVTWVFVFGELEEWHRFEGRSTL